MHVACVLALLASVVTSSAERTQEEAAPLARGMVRSVGFGSLSTSIPVGSMKGYPYSSVDIYAEDVCTSSRGDLLFFLSPLEMNVINYMAEGNNKVSLAVRSPDTSSPDPLFNARVTLLGNMTAVADPEAGVRDCYFAKHPEAHAWEHLKSHKFSFWRFQPQAVHWIGGFGDRHYIGWIDVDIYRDAQPEEDILMQ
ncbi:unnamed protein product [Vitrella brassicaformis CCMP3155]|uniref:CREG-like beta-barrel domain-containing protein n=2 Tax=Vitrella brassicaformis TaxID=1169539 RepID=A0A0G4FCE3_VITBC|nr:unnamed protein product [Vitrella brassicaformis CCMP3155]|eukprot:CEM10832.1 unnamed protein product [Vitrella brassicaformis CCMP3155]